MEDIMSHIDFLPVLFAALAALIWQRFLHI